ncbi:ArsR family transcriptional regulator [Dysgonomonas sp. BGC7]|nr:ArsR family transcriptional regulator [Dysgonomonas sp. BGC7]
MSIANTSQHLQILKNARLVTSDKRGNYAYYRIVSERAFHAWESVRDLGVELNSEISKLIADYKKGDPTLIATTGEDLIARIEAGEVILLDVNSEEVFNRVHIHKAISIPLDQLKKRIAELSKDKEIVAYCRGALCLLSDEAVELLRAEGFNVRKLVREVPDWIENYSGIVINQK